MIGKSLYLGEKIRLTALDVEKDASTLSKWTDQHAFDRRINFGMYRLISEYEMKKLLADKLKKAEEGGRELYFAVRLVSEDDLVGLAKIMDIYAANQVGNLQVDFGEPADLLRYGDELVEMMVRYSFMEISLYRLQVFCSAYETDLMALLERHGFMKDVQRREAVFHSGKYWDTYIYGILRGEYLYLEEVRAK